MHHGCQIFCFPPTISLQFSWMKNLRSHTFQNKWNHMEYMFPHVFRVPPERHSSSQTQFCGCIFRAETATQDGTRRQQLAGAGRPPRATACIHLVEVGVVLRHALHGIHGLLHFIGHCLRLGATKRCRLTPPKIGQEKGGLGGKSNE